MEEIARNERMDIVVTTEPNYRTAARHNWLADASGDVAIHNVSNKLGWQLLYRGDGILAVLLPDMVLVSGYISPNITLDTFEQYIFELTGVLQRATKRIVLMGDFNCKVTLAGSNHTNRRGEIFGNMMMAVGLVCLNDNSCTFEARGHRSVLDLTLINSRWDPSLFQWRVLREETASDHFVTLMTMKEALPPIACPCGYPRGQIVDK
ncbi:uncharacterized protein LOC142317567 [Lycorma delicatula]|uniref:uncharacterized protein LOC142317567 n=1 Tax=Lycorma delicatula TaxID=130591 RepID=UPI003F50DBA1